MVKYHVYSFNDKEIVGDISYNVFNRRKSLYYMLETLYFTIFSPMDNFNENNKQKFIIAVYVKNIY